MNSAYASPSIVACHGAESGLEMDEILVCELTPKGTQNITFTFREAAMSDLYRANDTAILTHYSVP